ncbi:hypothetical protein [Streptomyces sp. NBC_01264]|uniref:hypothetical protein n=1 Tax=Streptomyces sp. NBC_01264 TaxID=2903804 RepID=UPI00225691EB|nr:hypothetical protein [Streptomyces sp. NBC_01264]MCX4775816.1 hypothetical protein [Streptomyces sp. NBC_01264]
MSEIEILLGQAVPAISAAVSAYGAAVLTRAEDEAAGATVRLGQRLLERLRRNNPDRPALDVAVTDLAEADDDPDAVAALRLRIRQVLRDSPELRAELAALLPVPRAATSGERTVAVGGDMTGIVSNGDGATNTVRR